MTVKEILQTLDKEFKSFQESSFGKFLIEKIFFRTKGFYSVILSLSVILIAQLSALKYAEDLVLFLQKQIDTSEQPLKSFWYIADFIAPNGNWLIIIVLVFIIVGLFWIRNKELNMR